MAKPTLTPRSTTSVSALPVTGTLTNVDSATNPLPFGIYTRHAQELDDEQSREHFISGAVDQVAHTYKKLGGDILDVELTEYQVYAAYEEAVLEYSYIVNVHQAKNLLPHSLGNTTGSFDHDGELRRAQDADGNDISGSLGGSNRVELKYPRFRFNTTMRTADGVATEVGTGGSQTIYSASFDKVSGQSDYDLQSIVYSASIDSSNSAHPYYGKLSDSQGKKRLTIKKVFFKTPEAMWRFYGYYGGLHTVGNLAHYGQFADDSTWEIIPIWQNKLQALMYEDALWTRTSHYSYELRNNRLRIHPTPTSGYGPVKYWFQFTIDEDSWDEEDDRHSRNSGVNNMNTLPFANIPYSNINSIGKQWIRRFSLALCKEMLGQVRGKFATIPIPGESVTLNGSDLISQAKEEQEKLREELKTVLDELTYQKLAETDAAIHESTSKVLQSIPVPVFVG